MAAYRRFIGFVLALMIGGGLSVSWGVPAQAGTPGSWERTGNLTTPRFNPSLLLLPGGKVLAAGGLQPALALSSAEVYDPLSGIWLATGSMAHPHDTQIAYMLPNGDGLVAGGISGTGPGAGTRSAELYDPASGTWSTTGDMVVERGSASASVLLHDGRVLVTGGFNTIDRELSSTEIYNPELGAWTLTGSMSVPRLAAAAAVLPDGRVLVVGGGNEVDAVLASTEIYDPSTGLWSSANPMSTPRFNPSAVPLLNGTVLVTGGISTTNTPLASAEIFDPTSGMWSPTGSMGAGHDTYTRLRTGKVVAAGTDQFGLGPNTSEVYSPGSGTWTPTGSPSVSRFGAPALLLNSDEVLKVGGGQQPVTFWNVAELYTPQPVTVRPVVSAVIAPPPNGAGWNNTDVSLSWDVSDADSGITSSVGCESLVLNVETAGTTFTCVAVNGAGFTTSASATIRIDKTPPTVSYSGNAGAYRLGDTINITCAAADALSGIASTTCSDIVGPAFGFAPGVNTFSATAIDRAGNIGAASTTFVVVVDVAGIIDLVHRFVTQHGVATSLEAKLRALEAAAARGQCDVADNLRRAFIREVEAQAGRSLSVTDADLLISLASAVTCP